MAKELVSAPKTLSIWRKNMAKMHKRQPKMVLMLEEYAKKKGHSFEHYENETPAGRWIEGLTEVPFFESASDPVFPWDSSTREATIFFQYGIGTGSYLAKSIRSLPKEALSFMVVEPSISLLAYVLHTTDIYSLMPESTALTFLTTPDPDVLSGNSQTERERSASSLFTKLKTEALIGGIDKYGTYTVVLSLESLHSGELEALKGKFAQIKAEISEWIKLRLSELGNNAGDTLLGLRQMALMAPWIAYGYRFKKLLEDYRGRPFVIVSAGPSLDKNFNLLEKIKDKCVIVATDAVLGKMLAIGVKPHMVCALERGLPTYNSFFAEQVEKYPEECSKILLITQAVCAPKIYGRWPGPKIIVGKAELPMDKSFVVETLGGEAITSGASVAHMNYSICVAMGASSIALIGQDLSYSADGTSHAGGVFNDKLLKVQRRDAVRMKIYKVQGIDGGRIETNEVWLMFLRMLEVLIQISPVPTYDCTEGGALILGTTVEKFANYIEKNVEGRAAIKISPCELLLREGIPADRRGRADMLKPRIESTRKGIDEIDKVLADVSSLLDMVAIPDITQKQRLAHAQRVEELLNVIYSKNSMFAFITQSYVFGAGAEIAKNRFLETPEMIESWTSIYREMLTAHSVVSSFMRTWTDYAQTAIEYYIDRELPLEPPSADEAMKIFESVCENLGDGEDQISLRMEMDSIFASVDMIRFDWPPNILWSCAMFLQQEGRAEEARALMEQAAKMFEDKEMPAGDIISFFKDFARVLSTPDLCSRPNYQKAETILNNAIGRGCNDDEVQSIRSTINSGVVYLFENYAEFGGSYRKNRAKWMAARVVASEALAEGDVARAMRLLWDAISKYGVFIPQLSIPHQSWLAETMEKFFDVADEPYKSTVDELLTEMAFRTDVLSSLPVQYSERFTNALEKRRSELEASKIRIDSSQFSEDEIMNQIINQG